MDWGELMVRERSRFCGCAISASSTCQRGCRGSCTLYVLVVLRKRCTNILRAEKVHTEAPTREEGISTWSAYRLGGRWCEGKGAHNLSKKSALSLIYCRSSTARIFRCLGSYLSTSKLYSSIATTVRASRYVSTANLVLNSYSSFLHTDRC